MNLCQVICQTSILSVAFLERTQPILTDKAIDILSVDCVPPLQATYNLARIGKCCCNNLTVSHFASGNFQTSILSVMLQTILERAQPTLPDRP